MAVNTKRSNYFPHAMAAELEAEAKRTDRSVSWLLQQSWKIARERIATLPTVHAAVVECDNRGIVPPTP